MHHSFKMSYLEPILVHPVRRQNFGDAVAQTCNPHLIPCHNEKDVKESNDKEAHLRDVCWQVAQKGHGRLPG